MKRSLLLVWLLFLGGIVLAATDACGFVFWPNIEAKVSVSDLEAIQKGDKVYMSGQTIGEVTKAQLNAPQKGTITVKIYSDYKKLINESAVFTITADKLDRTRKCLLVKNCMDNEPMIKSGHQFKGYSGYRFETACLEERALRAWTEHYKAMVEDALESAGKLSEETIDSLKAFGQAHHEEFIKWMDGLIKEMEEMAPEVRRQLDELMNQLKNPKDEAPDAGDSNPNQINT